VTGNPVRHEFFEIAVRQPGQKIDLLIFGGSQGARAINEAMVAALPMLSKVKNDLAVTHQTGEANFDSVKAGYENAGWENVDIRPYIHNIAESFEWADLIICRAGATTCAEVAAAGRAAIMVPFPGAADDHQRKNAEAMAAEGACRTLLQSDLSGERLADEITALLDDPGQLLKMGEASRAMARPDAAQLTVDIIEELAAGN
jgi:UDP-N-acetylglucosamine--N-acetylmuramyl-(pentapeptide) pyrophosphoryl-undecaprenol N-acetylglucosamine transferase